MCALKNAELAIHNLNKKLFVSLPQDRASTNKQAHYCICIANGTKPEEVTKPEVQSCRPLSNRSLIRVMLFQNKYGKL